MLSNLAERRPFGHHRVMPDFELTRTREDRDRYELEGVGTLRLEGMFSTRATAEAAGQQWQIGRRGFWRQRQVPDAAGVVVGTFDRRLRGGGALTWEGRELVLERASVWRERYALVEGERELVLYEARSWGKRPVTVTIDDPGALDPGLLLFGAFVARSLAHDSASAGSTAAVG